MDISTVWKNLLDSANYGKQIVNPAEVEEVVGFMQRHRIDAQIVSGNLLALLLEGRPQMFSDDRPPLPTSPAIKKFIGLHMRPMGAPLWMIAGFPDVIEWLQGRLEDPQGQQSPERGLLALYGIDENQEDGAIEKELLNHDGEVRAKCYGNLIETYLKSTNKRPETAVEEGSSSDMYTAGAILQAMGEESNFTLIARNTARYYSQLRRSFGNRFANESLLLASAGVLDAAVYINVTRKIDIEQVIAMAETAATAANPLLEFAIQLETLMLSIDTPNVTLGEVSEACRGQSMAIEKTIGEVLSSSRVDEEIVLAVERFMKDHQYRELRKKLAVPDR